MEVSYDQFPKLALLVESTPAEHSDPCDLIADAEQTIADLYQINLQGNIMTNSVATALADAGITTARVFTRYANLDLLEVLKTKIIHPALKARVFASMAWMVDVTAINQARIIYYQMFHDAQLNGIDSYNEFMARFDELMRDFDGQDTNALSLRKLLGMRNEWHDAAESAAGEAKVRYAQKSFEDLLLAEKPQRVDTMTRTNLELLAGAIAPTNKDATIELLTKRQQMVNESRHESRRETMPFLLTIIDAAGRALEDGVQFHELTLELQERLVDAAAKTVERALEDLATNRKLTTIEYASIIQEALAAANELRQISRTRFGEQTAKDLTPEEKEEVKGEIEARRATQRVKARDTKRMAEVLNS